MRINLRSSSSSIVEPMMNQFKMRIIINFNYFFISYEEFKIQRTIRYLICQNNKKIGFQIMKSEFPNFTYAGIMSVSENNSMGKKRHPVTHFNKGFPSKIVITID